MLCYLLPFVYVAFSSLMCNLTIWPLHLSLKSTESTALLVAIQVLIAVVWLDVEQPNTIFFV